MELKYKQRSSKSERKTSIFHRPQKFNIQILQNRRSKKKTWLQIPKLSVDKMEKFHKLRNAIQTRLRRSLEDAQKPHFSRHQRELNALDVLRIKTIINFLDLIFGKFKLVANQRLS